MASGKKVKKGSVVDLMMQKLHARCFTPWREFEAAVCTVVNQHLRSFPPSYTYRDFIDWMRNNNWIRQDAEGKIWVVYDGNYAPKRFTVNIEVELVAYTKEEALKRVKAASTLLDGEKTKISATFIKREFPI